MKNGIKPVVCALAALFYIALLVLLPFSVVTFLLGVLVCNWLASLVHELGHLAAYGLLKLRWKRMVVSFFVFEAGSGLRFEANRGIYDASCTCTYDPETPLWRYDLALLSGGILGALLGIGAILLSLAVSGGTAAFLQCFGLVSLLHAAVNLLLPTSADRTLMRQIRKNREKNA